MSELTSRVEDILQSTLDNTTSSIKPMSRVEVLLKELNAKIDELSQATSWIGVTTTALTDGSSTNPITINNESVTAEAGNIASYNNVEFIFNGSTWQEFGDNNKIKIGSISLTTTYSGNDPYTQSVSVTGATVTNRSKITLQPTATQIEQLISDGVAAITVENNNGTLTFYAFSAAPSVTMSIACVVMEV